MGFLWLLLKMLFLMLLSAVGGYFFRKWLERSSYEDVTVTYSKAVANQTAVLKEHDSLKAQYASLKNSVDSKLDGVIGRFSPLEDKLSGIKLSDVENQIGAVKAQIEALPTPKDTDPVSYTHLTLPTTPYV